MVFDISLAQGAMTGARYIESLRDGREVWMDGVRIDDVPSHPAFSGIVNELADRVAVLYAGRIVETAPREALFRNPKHPYTQGLLRSMPALAPPGERLPEIPGVVPSPAEWPTGCRFASRCSRAMDKCGHGLPEFTGQGPRHEVACYAVSQANGQSGRGGTTEAEASR